MCQGEGIQVVRETGGTGRNVVPEMDHREVVQVVWMALGQHWARSPDSILFIDQMNLPLRMSPCQPESLF